MVFPSNNWLKGSVLIILGEVAKFFSNLFNEIKSTLLSMDRSIHNILLAMSTLRGIYF